MQLSSSFSVLDYHEPLFTARKECVSYGGNPDSVSRLQEYLKSASNSWFQEGRLLVRQKISCRGQERLLKGLVSGLPGRSHARTLTSPSR